MKNILLSNEEIEHLIKKQLPDIKMGKWTDKGILVEVDFLRLKPEEDKWDNITLYSFKRIKVPERVNFMIRQQKINGEDDIQMILNVK